MKSRTELDYLATKLRKLLGADISGPIDLFTLVLNKDDITLVFYPFEENVSGMCVKKARMIVINSNSTYGRQRFSLAHELYHLYFDESSEHEISFEYTKVKSVTEKEADIFASYLLMPNHHFYEKVQEVKGKDIYLDIKKLIKLEQFFQVSHHALLTRLLDDSMMTEREVELNKNNVLSIAKQLGYGQDLYKPYASMKNSKKVLGAYFKKIDELVEKSYITDGRHREYLSDAFEACDFDDDGK